MTSDVTVETAQERHQGEGLPHTRVLVGRQAFFLWLVLSAPFALIGRGTIFSSDEGGTFNTGLSLLFRGSLAIGPGENVHPGRDEQLYACREIFPSLLCIPPALAGSVVEFGVVGSPPPRSKSMSSRRETAHWPHFFVTTLLGPLALSLTLLTLRKYLLSEGVSIERTWVIVLAVGWSTPLLYYSKTIFGQVFEAALLMAALHFARRWRTANDVGALTLLGAVCGLGLMTRAVFATVVVWFSIYLIIVAWGAAAGSPKRNWSTIVRFLLPVTLGALLTGWINWLRWDSPFDFGYHNPTEVFNTSLWRGGLGALFSPGKGLFFYTPLLWLAAASLGRSWRAGGRLEFLLVGSISATYLVIYGRWSDWTGGMAWGPRFLVPLIPLWIAITGSAWRQNWTPLIRMGFVSAVVSGIAIQILGIAIHPYWSGYHATDPFSWSQGHLVRHAILLYRYGVDDFWLTNPAAMKTRFYFPLIMLFLSGTALAILFIKREIELSWKPHNHD